MAWTDEDKQTAIAMYLAAEPTAANSIEIVKGISEKMGQTANGVRMILTKAKNEDGSNVYIAKEAGKAPAASGGTTAAAGDKAPRVSKEAAHAALTAAITEAGATVDSEIISKLTGKAAQYFTGVLTAANGGDQD
jgi:hypothetical protein